MNGVSIQPSSPFLDVKNLTLTAHHDGESQVLVNDVSFSLMAHETLAIVGQSGSGKTLTALALLGLLPAEIVQTFASIRLGNLEIRNSERDRFGAIRGRGTAMIFQDPVSALNPTFRIGLQMDDIMKRHRLELTREERRSVALSLLHRTGLAEAERVYCAYPHELSGGMAQRVMIAMALSCKPRLLIADEATTSLDVTTQAQILTLLRTLREEEKFALLLITHDLRIVEAMADRVLVLHAGRVVEEGTVSAVFRSAQSPHTQKLLRAVFRVPGVNKRDIRYVNTTVSENLGPFQKLPR